MRQGEWGSEFSCAPALDLSPSACVSVSSVPSLRAGVSTSLLVIDPQMCPSCSECGPNVSVRRIEASFRKRGDSLSGNPCLRHLILLRMQKVFASVGCASTSQKVLEKKIPFREWRAIRFRESLRRH